MVIRSPLAAAKTCVPFGILACVAALAAYPSLQTPHAVAGLRWELLHSSTSPKRSLLPGPDDTPTAVLSVLSADPLLRASCALYNAAILHPAAAKAIFNPRALTGSNRHGAIRSAVSQAEQILSSQDPDISTGLGISVYGRTKGSRLSAHTGSDILGVIDAAARLTGTDPAFLRAAAARESSLNPYAVASRSSARGLFQFIDQTWLLSVFKWGARHGLAGEAALIRKDSRGRALVSNPADENRILLLRYEPQAAARMAAESAAENAAILERVLARAPNRRELYAAHLLGPHDALRLVITAYADPAYPADQLLPKAATYNPGLFYRGGAVRSVSELLRAFP